jgi:hypothetical protein
MADGLDGDPEGMEDVTDSVVRLLRGAPEIAGIVGVYIDGPAVFGGGPIPEDAPYPRVVVNPPEDATTATDMAHTLWSVVRVVICLDQGQGDPRLVERLADRVRRRLYTRPAPIGCAVLGATPGTVADVTVVLDEDIYARSVPVSYLIETAAPNQQQ